MASLAEKVKKMCSVSMTSTEDSIAAGTQNGSFAARDGNILSDESQDEDAEEDSETPSPWPMPNPDEIDQLDLPTNAQCKLVI